MTSTTQPAVDEAALVGQRNALMDIMDDGETANPVAAPAAGGNDAERAAARLDEGELTDAADLMEFMRKLERIMYTSESGGPSVFFVLAMVFQLGMLAIAASGMFLFPSPQQAYEADDPLMMGALLAFCVFLAISMPMYMLESRKVMRARAPPYTYSSDDGSDGYSVLGQLAERDPMISENGRKRFLGMKKYVMEFELNPAPFLLLSAYVAYSGEGLQSPERNRITAMVFAGFVTFSRPTVYPCLLSLRLATMLVAAEVTQVRRAVQSRPDTAERWEREVAVPIRRLIGTMELLTSGYGRMLLIDVFILSPPMLVAMTSMFLSPMLDGLGHGVAGEYTPFAIRGVNVFMITIFATAPFFKAMGPAEVSTACDDLKEELNLIRLETLDQEADMRVTLLERAMQNVNHGQGIGFKVAGVVVDVKMLNKIGLQVSPSPTDRTGFSPDMISTSCSTLLSVRLLCAVRVPAKVFSAVVFVLPILLSMRQEVGQLAHGHAAAGNHGSSCVLGAIDNATCALLCGT